MQMQQTLSLPQPPLLRRTLLGNAAFSTLCGLAGLLWSKPLALSLGISEPFILLILGIAILLFALAVAWIALRPPLNIQWVTIVLLLDVAWVVASAILLLDGLVTFSALGKWLVIGVADVVACFAILEYWGLRQLRNNQ